MCGDTTDDSHLQSQVLLVPCANEAFHAPTGVEVTLFIITHLTIGIASMLGLVITLRRL